MGGGGSVGMFVVLWMLFLALECCGLCKRCHGCCVFIVTHGAVGARVREK